MSGGDFQNHPSDAEFITICVSLTSKYGRRVQLATYTVILLVRIANLLKKSGHNSDKLLSSEATFVFLFALLTFFCFFL